MGVSTHVKEAWKINESVNTVLLEHLSPDMLYLQTPGGGRNVLQQLAHMTEARKFWGTRLDKSIGELPDLDVIGRDDSGAETRLDRIKEVMKETSRKLLESADHADSKGDLPFSSVEVFLIYIVSHDAHHRGQLSLALKTAGFSLPDEGALWGLWREA